MRTTDERTRRIRARAAELERRSRDRKRRLLTALSCAGGLALPLLLAVWISSRAGANDGLDTYRGMAASVFADSPAAACVTVGVLSFALGVCVTLLCLKAKRLKREEEDEP